MSHLDTLRFAVANSTRNGRPRAWMRLPGEKPEVVEIDDWSGSEFRVYARCGWVLVFGGYLSLVSL